MRNQSKNLRTISFKNLNGNVIEAQVLDEQDQVYYYTGELTPQYDALSTLKVVINYQGSKVYDEQHGVIYQYSATMQHTGEPIISEKALVWIDKPTTGNPDYKVEKVIPSPLKNSTIYHLKSYQPNE